MQAQSIYIRMSAGMSMIIIWPKKMNEVMSYKIVWCAFPSLIVIETIMVLSLKVIEVLSLKVIETLQVVCGCRCPYDRAY